LLVAMPVLASCDRARPQPEQAAAKGETAMSITLTSTAFAGGQPIPARHSAEGKNISPALRWENLPPGTKELALICDDPDAPTPQPWVHWVIYKIAPDATGLEEGVSTEAKPAGAIQGKGTSGEIGYSGPLPPRGHGVHHYHFKVYALGKALDLGPGLDKEGLLSAMKGHVLAEGELVGTYQR
jgi:hypothetical protein